MQTFVPYGPTEYDIALLRGGTYALHPLTEPFPRLQCFDDAAVVLDVRRLGCQIKEAWQIDHVLHEGGRKQGNPHAYAMWEGYRVALVSYGLSMYREWQYRYMNGLRNGKLQHASGEALVTTAMRLCNERTEYRWPEWLTDSRIFSSHRAALRYKGWCDAIWFGWTHRVKPCFPDKYFDKPKHRMTANDWVMLYNITVDAGVDIARNNHYAQYHWDDQPYDTDANGRYLYAWPTPNTKG